MLKWTTSFFVLAIASGVIGFTGVAGPESGAAGFLFFVFSYLCFVTALLSGLSGNPPLAWLRAPVDQWQHRYEDPGMSPAPPKRTARRADALARLPWIG